MSSSPPLPESTPAPKAAARSAFEETIADNKSRNLLALATHHIVLRIAWIFKTETVIMPAFLDTIAGAGWLRGCMPVLNRIGQSVPSLLLADRLRLAGRKKWTLLITALMMSAPFLILSAIWFLLDDKRQIWLPGVFLVLYFVFFSTTGLNQLTFSTLQGKLIRANRRGKLMSVSGMLGALFAILCAWFILRHWVTLPDGGFGHIFGFTGIGFAVSGFFCLAIVEPPDVTSESGSKSKRHFRDAWALVRDDHDFRRLSVVTMLFMTAQLLFPHYQAMARQEFQAGGIDLMIWVIAQNAGGGAFSLFAGAVADRFGNRLVIRSEVFAAALTPILAIALARTWFGNGVNLFWITFVLLGLIPVTVKSLVNYALELSDPSNHPRYISTLKLCMAIPFCLSPLVGLLVDFIGFAAVFASVSTAIVAGGLLIFTMSEPREKLDQT